MNFTKLFVLMLLLATTNTIKAQTATGTLVFSESFNNGLTGWAPLNNATWVNDATGKYLKVENTNAASAAWITRDLDLTTLRGAKLALSADVKAENVVSTAAWRGIKVMLAITKAGETTPSSYPQITLGTGTFGWQKKGTVIEIPATAVKAQLLIGIQEATGKVWFDNISIKVKSSAYPAARSANIPIQKYHAEPSLRGVMVSQVNTTPTDVADLKTWKANVVRWQFGVYNPNLTVLDPNYDNLVTAEIAKLNAALPNFEAKGIKIILDLHSLSQKALQTAAGQRKLIAVWDRLARVYKDKNIIWAYDLANEPLDVDPTTIWQDDILLWEDLAEAVAKAIRAIDATKPILITSIWGTPNHFTTFKPISFAIPNIIYTTHFYEPLAFSHQGITGNAAVGAVYPGGVLGGVTLTKAGLKAALKPVKDFQDKYRVPILIGEFSAVRYAPNNSAYNYMKDCIEIFEEYNWDWVYHAFRESDEWDVELSTNRANTTTRINVTSVNATDRAKLLGQYFGANVVSPCVPLTPATPSVSSITLSSATISWAAVAGAVNYRVEYKPNTATTWTAVNTTATSIPITGLTAATLYNVRVYSFCSATIMSQASPITNVTTIMPCADVHEPNNTTATAKVISPNGITIGSISTVGDNDYYRITTTLPLTNVNIILTQLSTNFDLELYNAAGTKIASSTRTGALSEFISFAATTAGTYTIRVFGANGALHQNCYQLTALADGATLACPATSPDAVNLSSTNTNSSAAVQNEERAEAMTLTLFPNPAKSLVNLKVSVANEGEYDVHFYDMIGKEAISQKTQLSKGDNQWSVPTETLAKGMYIIRVVKGQESVTKKLTIE